MVGVDGNHLKELFDQSLIKLCDVNSLTGDEVLQLLDSIHYLFLVVAVDFRLFHLVAESENFVSDGVPFCLSSAGEDAVSHKPGGNFIHAGAFQIFAVDTLYNFCLLRVDNQVLVCVFAVSEEAIVIDLHLILLIVVLQSQFDVLAH